MLKLAAFFLAALTASSAFGGDPVTFGCPGYWGLVSDSKDWSVVQNSKIAKAEYTSVDFVTRIGDYGIEKHLIRCEGRRGSDTFAVEGPAPCRKTGYDRVHQRPITECAGNCKVETLNTVTCFYPDRKKKKEPEAPPPPAPKPVIINPMTGELME